MSNLINRRWENTHFIFQFYFLTVVFAVCNCTARGTICAAIKGPAVPGIAEGFWNCMSFWCATWNLCLNAINKSIVGQWTSSTVVCRQWHRAVQQPTECTGVSIRDRQWHRAVQQPTKCTGVPIRDRQWHRAVQQSTKSTVSWSRHSWLASTDCNVVTVVLEDGVDKC